MSVRSPIKSTLPISKYRNKSNNKKQKIVDIVIEVNVSPIGDALLVHISVKIICPANIKAQSMVNHSEIS